MLGLLKTGRYAAEEGYRKFQHVQIKQKHTNLLQECRRFKKAYYFYATQKLIVCPDFLLSYCL